MSEIEDWEVTMAGLVERAYQENQIEIFIGEDLLLVDVAASDHARKLGLSQTSELSNDGMLFSYESNVDVAYSMAHMNYDLNIYWFDENYDMIGSTSAKAGSTEPVEAPTLYRYVLETDLEGLEGPLRIGKVADLSRYEGKRKKKKRN